MEEVEGKRRERNGVEWNGVERARAEWSARGQNGIRSNGREGNGTQSSRLPPICIFGLQPGGG